MCIPHVNFVRLKRYEQTTMNSYDERYFKQSVRSDVLHINYLIVIQNLLVIKIRRQKVL